METKQFLNNLVQRYELLNKEEEEALISAYQSRGDISARNTVVNANLRFVLKVAYSNLNKGLDLDELFAAGSRGLIAAIENYKIGSSRFVTYAKFYIENAIKEDITQKKSIQIPEYVIKANAKISKAKIEFYQTYERNADYQELSEFMDGEFTSDQIQEYIEMSSVSNSTISLDSTIKSYDGDITLGDTVKAASYDEIENQNKEDSKYEIIAEACMSYLQSPRDRDIIARFFGVLGHSKESLQSIGDSYGISRQAVNQLKNKALASMAKAYKENH